MMTTEERLVSYWREQYLRVLEEVSFVKQELEKAELIMRRNGFVVK